MVDLLERLSIRDGIKRPSIQDRPHCTHECLRGLTFGGPIDEKCPNSAAHGNIHLNQLKFLPLARAQLAVDRGHDADCMPLWISDAHGTLFKFRLSSHGYTLAAKGVEIMDIKYLHHESKVYSHAQDLQGRVIPVCLGVIDLIKPYYYDCGVYENFMFLSYGGRSLKRQGDVSEDAMNEILTTLGQLYCQGVLHCDAELRNVLYDKDTSRYMMIDLERSEIHARQPLGTIKVNNSRNQKRKSGLGKLEKDVFAIEAQSLQTSLRWRQGPV